MNEDALRALIRQTVARHLTPDVAAAEDTGRTQPLTLAGQVTGNGIANQRAQLFLGHHASTTST